MCRLCIFPLKSITGGVHSRKSVLAGWRETEGETEGERGRVMCAFICITDLPNVTVSQRESPTPTLLSHPHLPISLPLPSRLCLPLPEGDQLTATSWGGPEASCPCPRALLASVLDRMDRDRVIHCHSTLHAHTGM